ncbi:type I polyketide synthase [Parvularcula sp. LCG005]|uniref:type I polyketide synthase n=1 Tax=Parvularcula sp. LCG005 TaxID=3078805 RepID=UPI002942FC5C|nr:type I polyketide synthase [Parvularcula sp. LCG005]WOI51992.1 type I polyketide synthase [Parvularcula sp. LCG005]
MTDTAQSGIAIVGMAGRFPGAQDVATFWENIKAGKDTISHFEPEELEIPQPAGEGDGQFVRAKGVLDDIDKFDARFFGYLPREAEVMDPQHRVFLEICWEAMEHAGHDAARYDGAVGVYAGCYMDTYLINNLCADEKFRRDLIDNIQVGTLQTELGNDKDYLATRVAFKMGLRGPAMTIQTACSTSLVAIASACQALDTYGCDMALAGGVTIVLPQKRGYFYKEGGMLSPDGTCRTFSSDAAGTVFSNGAAVLLLKRVEDAIADGNTIYAVIRGYGTNNDGGTKVSYTAPSVEGQAEVISLAMGLGEIDARSIGYVEAHGTATPLGDPIEIAGLTTAYRRDTDDRQYCAIGSVKANLGHLDAASGAIGLIKTSLSVHEGVLPPQIHYAGPNPNIDFEATPFYVNTALNPWPAAQEPRRAAVSSFGVGGTNAHVVIESAPTAAERAVREEPQILVLSARTDTALAQQKLRLAAYLEANPQLRLDDVSHTLQVGRRQFEQRTAIVARSPAEAIERLRMETPIHKPVASSPGLLFQFPGQGVQYPGMARQHYAADAVFKATIDNVIGSLSGKDQQGKALKGLLLWDETSPLSGEAAAAQLAQTSLAQPAIFAMEIALAHSMRARGIVPDAVIGHSIGEFAAAVLANVMDLDVAARLVALRGRLMQQMPAGKMLAVRLSADEATSYISGEIDLAAINSPSLCVLSGPTDAMDALTERLTSDEVAFSVLKTSHAFHSAMMAPARESFEEAVAALDLRPAQLPVFSTVTGMQLSDKDMMDPAYWGQQITSPVRYVDAIRLATAEASTIVVEVGPGQTLSTLARQSVRRPGFSPVSVLGPVQEPGDDEAHLLAALGALWGQGVALHWSDLRTAPCQRIPLPTYPFERQRHWVDPPARQPVQEAVPPTMPAPANAAPDGSIEQLVETQLRIIAAQLAALKS